MSAAGHLIWDFSFVLINLYSLGVRPGIRENTQTLVFDGTEEEVHKNIRACQTYFRYWNFCRGAFRVRVGNRLVYTTPLSGTFYYVIRYKGRHLVFVIVARQYWLIGFFGENGFFQMVFEGQSSSTPYMNSTKGTVMTLFSANHNDISPEGVESTRLDIHAMRAGFDSIHSYRGPNHPLPDGFPAAIGRIAVLIMETKFREILERCDRAIVGSEQTRLGDGMKNLVVNWSTMCSSVLEGILKSHHTLEDIAKLRWLLQQILIYQVDATSIGLFAHPPLPPEPRMEVWQPIDDEYIDGGKADSAVPNFDAPPPLQVPRHIANRGVKRGISQIKQPAEKMIRKGLRGGGAGGSPDVPHWFASWKQENDNKDQCDMLVAGAREIGLTVAEVGPLLLMNKNTEDNSEQGGEGMNNPPQSDLADLRSNSFLSDTVITNFFNQLSSRFDNNEVLLVHPASAIAYAQHRTAINPEYLRDRRIVVLPVNNAAEFWRPDRGSHWSVLVIDATAEGSPRFIHHDSLGELNLSAARHLASRMHTIFPTAQEVENARTPRQQTGYDCAVYVMAIARSITRWWRRRKSDEDWMDRMWNEVTEENILRIRQQLAEDLEKEQLEKETKNVECKKDKTAD